MKCPHCNNDIELTWKRYWKAPLGRHTCPQCCNRFRMKHSLWYYGALLGLCCFSGLIPAVLALLLGATGMQALITYWIFVLLAAIPIDKKIDATWRGTIPLDIKKQEDA